MSEPNNTHSYKNSSVLWVYHQNASTMLIATIQSWLAEEMGDVPQFPYHLRDDFLSPAELNFYRVLQTAVSDHPQNTVPQYYSSRLLYKLEKILC